MRSKRFFGMVFLFGLIMLAFTWVGCGQTTNTEGDEDDQDDAGANFIVTYHPGIYGSGATQTAAKIPGASLTLRNMLFVRNGYIQDGWSKSANGNVKHYDLKGTYGDDEDITLFPFWADSSYTGNVIILTDIVGVDYEAESFGSIMMLTPVVSGGDVPMAGGEFVGDNGYFELLIDIFTGEEWNGSGEFKIMLLLMSAVGMDYLVYTEGKTFAQLGVSDEDFEEDGFPLMDYMPPYDITHDISIIPFNKFRFVPGTWMKEGK